MIEQEISYSFENTMYIEISFLLSFPILSL